jgi:REP element-mobilizing transposase RayT
MPRQARLDAPGTLHHVMIRGIEKGKIVDDRKDRQTFLEYMGNTALENDTKIYAFALMTNHAHILLKSGKTGISKYMRRFLTRYAIAYNRRHKRHGYLFQNRYKSIICEEDTYFQELVRYIHLNPLRAKLVNSLNELDKYPWCGHGSIMGNQNYEWLDRAYVLKWFGKAKEEAARDYREYLEKGIPIGSRTDLTGGSLIRALGRWGNVSTKRVKKDKKAKDERILGSESFVNRVLKEAEVKIKHQLPEKQMAQKIENLIKKVCKEENILISELQSGSRRGQLPKIRLQIALRLMEEYGTSLAEIARQLGITLSAVSKMVSRHESGLST